MYRTAFFIFIAVSVMGCTKSKQATTYNDIPVIEAYLQVGSPVSVKLKHQVPFSSDTKVLGDLDNLSVQITDDSSTFRLTHVDSGTYVDSDLLAKADHSYKLSFYYNGKLVTATAHTPSKPEHFKQSATSISIEKITSGSFPSGGFTQPDPVDLTWDNNDGSYYMVLVKNIESKPEVVFDTTGIGSPPSAIFRNQPTTRSSFSINATQFQYFGKHLIILYHLNPDYAALYNSNGTTSQNLVTLSNSITNGEGIFTALNADTLFLQVNKK